MSHPPVVIVNRIIIEYPTWCSEAAAGHCELGYELRLVPLRACPAVLVRAREFDGDVALFHRWLLVLFKLSNIRGLRAAIRAKRIETAASSQPPAQDSR